MLTNHTNIEGYVICIEFGEHVPDCSSRYVKCGIKENTVLFLHDADHEYGMFPVESILEAHFYASEEETKSIIEHIQTNNYLRWNRHIIKRIFTRKVLLTYEET